MYKYFWKILIRKKTKLCLERILQEQCEGWIEEKMSIKTIVIIQVRV